MRASLLASERHSAASPCELPPSSTCPSLPDAVVGFLVQPKSDKAELDDEDKAFQQKKREEAAALKKLKEVAGAKGGFAKVTATGKKK